MPGQLELLETPADLVVTGEEVEVRLESQYGEGSDEDRQADPRITLFQARDRLAGDAHAGGQLALQHMPAQPSDAQAIAEFGQMLLAAGEDRPSLASYVGYYRPR